MSAVQHSSQAHSLAAARTGDAVQVSRILFDTLRVLCDELGLREGDVVRCRAGTGSHLLLETRGGRTVSLERDWARFVQVVDAGLDAEPSVPAA